LTLAKSRKSAIIIACIVFLSVTASAILWRSISLWLQGKLVTSLQANSLECKDLLILFLGLPLFLLVFGILPGAFIIYSRDEVYFGLPGAVRWAIFGILWTVLVFSIRTLLPDFNCAGGFGTYFMQRVINAIAGLICAYIAFRVAFLRRHPTKEKEDLTSPFT
jgi:hypothetical protein